MIKDLCTRIKSGFLSKKGDTLTAYHYHTFPAYDQRIILPRAIAVKLIKRTVTMNHVTVDINDYFNPIYIKQDIIIRFWQTVMGLKPWEIKDDAQDGFGCPMVKGKAPNDSLMQRESPFI